jgi:cell shape-determining protein MreC
MKYRTIENKIELQQYWIGFIVAVLLLLVIENIGLMNSFRGFIERRLSPVQKLGVNIVYFVELPYRVTVASYNSYQKIQNLELRYGELASRLGEEENLRVENDELRKMAGATTSSRLSQKILAPILGYSQPIIADTEQAFSAGDPVFIQGVFIGRVGEVSQGQAKVILLSQLFAQPVLAKTESGATGLLFGNGRDAILKEVPIEKEISVGQHVFTVGQEGTLPNWYIGTIKEVIRHEGSPTQEAIVNQGVSFFESKMVEIK